MNNDQVLLDKVLKEIPDVHEVIGDLQREAWQAADPRLLEICRQRIMMLLGVKDDHKDPPPAGITIDLDSSILDGLADWPNSDHFGAKEKACLAFTEQWLVDVAGMSDEIKNEVIDNLGEEAAISFVNALLVVEQRIRLALAWRAVL